MNILDDENKVMSRIPFDKFIEPAVITTLVIAATYYIGQAFINSYYGRLGIDTNSLEFSTSFYVQQSGIPVIIGVAISYLSLSVTGNQKYENKQKNALFGNLLFFLVGLLILFVGFQQIDKTFYIVIAFIVLTATILLTYLGFSFTSSMKSNFVSRIAICIVVFAIFVLTSQSLGSNQAEALVMGRYTETLSIRFDWKDIKNDPAPQELNTDLILVLKNKGNYYILKRVNDKNPNLYPEIYMIPEANIKFAVIKKVVEVVEKV
jgi:hypothetical protein